MHSEQIDQNKYHANKIYYLTMQMHILRNAVPQERKFALLNFQKRVNLREAHFQRAFLEF